MPTERELCEKFGFSRRAVRKAIGFLEVEGKIWRHVGRGTFVGVASGEGMSRHINSIRRYVLEDALAGAEG